ncbi:heavy metal-associated isoprenylated plant protein 9-like isoform X2 [Olea europaea var. sylvestris]|uniref:heavy metal-associated isoprenylated plant protein 9-like isoform X2 n=1 Tax=Olea europaea var. sylvestris TaxID=158386 RepID=UPI000C1CDCB6|nr:heavy metal-associated isoprenylated plant protein 9-like isoform X2 [Olea europaea var. sylvestris]
MGEQVEQEKTQEGAKPEEKKVEEIKEEPKPPSPLVLFVDLHCVGCAKKIERSILKIRGVEGVVIDMVKNQITVEGVVEAQVVCNKIMKKIKRRIKVLSPLPESEGEAMSEVVASQDSELTTMELNVNMHCLACAQQLKRKILKLKGVQIAETEFSSGKIKVTGTMDADKLVDYIYKSTKKQAKIIPQPETEESKPKENKDEKKPDEAAKQEEEKNEERGENEEKGEEKGGENKEEPFKEGDINFSDEEAMHKLVHYYQPLYVIERIPPPQLFSDENPNACCII